METSKEFTKRKEAMIAKKYNTDEIEMRVFNSDGGSWIKTLYAYNDSVEAQLDQFHLKKAIKECRMGKGFETAVFSLLNDSKKEETLEYIEAVLNSVDDDKQIEKISKLYSYLKNNKQGLIPYQKRGLKLPDLNDGLMYRGMGSCEHNVYLTVSKRMKHRSAAWSPEGSLKLCKIICLKVSKTLKTTLETISTFEMPERMTEEIKSVLSAGKIPQTVGKGYEGRLCAMPYANAALTQSRKSLINWLKGR